MGDLVTDVATPLEDLDLEIREAFGRQCWIQYMPHAGAIEVRDIGWAG